MQTEGPLRTEALRRHGAGLYHTPVNTRVHMLYSAGLVNQVWQKCLGSVCLCCGLTHRRVA
jgi:hypothetical protein